MLASLKITRKAGEAEQEIACYQTPSGFRGNALTGGVQEAGFCDKLVRQEYSGLRGSVLRRDSCRMAARYPTAVSVRRFYQYQNAHSRDGGARAH